jgi:hypothetical protein
MIFRLHTLVGSAPVLERAVLSATMTAIGAKQTFKPDDRCARNFMPAICIAAIVIFRL